MRIGLFGFGHLGTIHAKCIAALDEIELVGIFDPDPDAKESILEKGFTPYESADDLIQSVDAVDIVTPTVSHFAIAKTALKAGKHLFIEKPVTNTLEEAHALQNLVREKNLCLQVGHVERFNPAFLSLEGIDLHPQFIEGHRLATFNPRGTDVSVVLDLMIHDLDMILHLTGSQPVDVQSHGVAIVSKSHDICNARIRFEDGCVVNLTASRISLKQMRKLRLFQADAYISMDFLERKSEIVRIFDATDFPGELEHDPSRNFLELDTYNGKKMIEVSVPEKNEVNAIQEELKAFYHSVIQGKAPKVSIEDGKAALELAYTIIENNEKKQ